MAVMNSHGCAKCEICGEEKHVDVYTVEGAWGRMEYKCAACGEQWAAKEYPD